MMPPGRNTTTSTKSSPSVRFQPSPTNFEATAVTGSAISAGRNAKKRCTTLSLKAEKMFSKYSMNQAPITGPTSVPTPPRMVISTTSPDAVHCMRSVPASGSVMAKSAPARPANMPEMTKAVSV